MTRPYFAQHYPDLRMPLAEDGDDGEGFRPAQAGAAHAVAAHFTRRTDPAIVTMPTGAGKTAVLMAVAFLLRARRVLVITPSRLVREQITEQFASLAVLRRIGALAAEVPGPRVVVADQRPATDAEWAAMREADVVVGTPAAISPGLEGVPDPPDDLFDLVLVDEAHHSPAPTWRSLLDGFPRAKRVLFTATPFRRDRREIKGRFAYSYDIGDAHRDGVFGQIRFAPVAESEDLRGDRALAKAAEAQLREDAAAGYDHRLMVRTDSKQRARELATVYEETGLRLATITSAYSLAHVKRIIRRLRAGELDGIICVNMLGEGFDLPALKVAAIHTPHRSLAVTLQFIGRFARTTGDRLGPATFLAIPSEIEVEATQLYKEDAAWQDVVANLSATRVTDEIAAREFIDTFVAGAGHDPADGPDASEAGEISLHAFAVGHHAKIYQVGPDVDIARAITFPGKMEVIYHEVSEDHRAAVFATREVRRTPWLKTGQVVDVLHGGFVVHHHTASGLLFICASQDYRVDGVYEAIAGQFAPTRRALSAPRLNKVLVGLKNPAFFNVGMRSRVIGSASESYRIMAGSGADKSIRPSDARLYNQGHVFGRGEDDGTPVTIGLSSASKVWSARTSHVPALVEWCDRLAERIAGEEAPQTLCNLDYLSPGEEALWIPDGIIAADWDQDAYFEPPAITYVRGKEQVEGSLLDLTLEVEGSRTDRSAIGVAVHGDGVVARYTYRLDGVRYFEPATPEEPMITLARGPGRPVPLLEYLNAKPLNFFTADFSALQGGMFYPVVAHDLQAFDTHAIEAVSWRKERVDVGVEFEVPGKVAAADGHVSIHAYLERRLASGPADVVFYDHGSGEVADFVTITREALGPTEIVLYHCKGAASEGGDRVEDAAEVCMQAVKSVPLGRLKVLRKKIGHRTRTRPGKSRFVKGDPATAERLLGDDQRARAIFRVVVVQPGFSRGALSPKLGSILGAANDFLARANFMPLEVLGSA